jgi:hypothetical protein
MPQVLTYLQPFFLEWAYFGRRLEGETQRVLRKVYGILQEYNNEIIPPIQTRIHERHPSKDLRAIWGNVNMAYLHDTVKSIWYRATHDILPTNERLRRINLSATADCQKCGVMDTPIHHLRQCGEAAEIRDWTRKRIELFHRIYPMAIPLTWLLFPDFRLWPPPKHNATLSILGHMVYCRFNGGKALSLIDYLDFLHRMRWKTYQWPKRLRIYGNYLDVIERSVIDADRCEEKHEHLGRMRSRGGNAASKNTRK